MNLDGEYSDYHKDRNVGSLEVVGIFPLRDQKRSSKDRKRIIRSESRGRCCRLLAFCSSNET